MSLSCLVLKLIFLVRGVMNQLILENNIFFYTHVINLQFPFARFKTKNLFFVSKWINGIRPYLSLADEEK